ncbi:MAG TPA: ATP-binding cassette domain-containing protein, partial [Kofleriaceae bacterium]|nr:ATP-binding cassette domain-containing protein [Kofleriaceae bacterium]
MATDLPATRKNLLLPQQERWPLDPDKPVIELQEVSMVFGDKRVLDKLSIKIIPGRTTVIVGRSGSGKSVLLKLMMGLLKPTSGKVLLFGQDLSTITPYQVIELRKRMGMLFQNYALFDALNVEDNVGFPLIENSKVAKPEIHQLAEGLIRTLHLG